MAIYPGASVRLIDTRYLSGAPMAVFNRTNLHTQAGNGSLYGYFNASNRASSHFWVAKSGLVEQYVDTALRAEADLDGNDATVSIETEGNGEPWTGDQLNGIIGVVSWILSAHGIPVKMATNAFSGSDSSKGISWHRLGIDGNFPAAPSRYAGRQQLGGGMHYSSAYGKTCPVEPRIDQIYDVVWPAVSSGQPVPIPPDPGPGPTPPGGLTVDGFWGSATTRRAQEVLGTEVDGEVWYQYGPNKQAAFTTGWVYNWSSGKGSPLIKEMQRRLGVDADGVWGTNTTNAFEVHYGYPPDGFLSGPSNTVKRFQEALNRGEF